MVRMVVFAAILALMPSAARAQATERESGPSLGELSRKAVAVDSRPTGASNARSPETQPRKDPLWNGVLIGAGLGAVIGSFAASAAFECHECTGFNVPLTFGVIGAGAGAAIGAAIDAWRHPRSRTPSPSAHTRRVVVAPVIGKNAGGVVASIDLSK